MGRDSAKGTEETKQVKTGVLLLGAYLVMSHGQRIIRLEEGWISDPFHHTKQVQQTLNLILNSELN